MFGINSGWSRVIARCALVAWLPLNGPVAHGKDAPASVTVPIARILVQVEPNAPSSVQLAATELRNHLNAMSDGILPTGDSPPKEPFTIHLGDSDFARSQGVDIKTLPHEGFQIKTSENWMIIAGRDYAGPPLVGFNNPWRLHETYNDDLKISAFGDAGTLQGVYAFLRETAGVRWYMPGPLGAIIPKQSTLKLKTGTISDSPAFEHRHAYFGFMPTSNDDALWYRRVGFGTPAPVQITHSLGHFFLKFKDSHPEYFALIDGQRDFTTLSTIVGPGNFDLTNEDFQAAVVKEIRAYFDANPDQLVFPLSPNDGMKRITDAPEAQRQITPERGELGKFSNYFWGFVNKVATEVAKTHPDRIIGSLAYEAYTLPPTNIEKLSPNVAVMYCKTRGNFTDPAYKESIRKGLTDWKEKAKNIYCWEYYNEIFNNSSWKGYPAFYPALIEEDLRWLHKLPTRGEFIEAESWRQEDYAVAGSTKINYPGLQHLNLYLTSTLLRHPESDVRELLKEYYPLFYGPGAPKMQEFWEQAEQAWMDKGKFSAPSQVYSAERLSKMLALLEEAQRSVPADSDYARRITLITSEFKPAAKKRGLLEKLQHPTVSVPTWSKPGPVDEEFWKALPVLTLLNRSFQKASPPTHVSIYQSGQELRMEIICFEPKIESLVARAQTRDQSEQDPIWTDDTIEIFFSNAKTNDAEVVQFIVNSRGAFLDSHRNPHAEIANTKWNSDAVISVTTEPGKWIIHLAIPLKDLPVALNGDQRSLAANIYRNRFAGGAMEQSGWAPLTGGKYLEPTEFGTLLLSK